MAVKQSKLSGATGQANVSEPAQQYRSMPPHPHGSPPKIYTAAENSTGDNKRGRRPVKQKGRVTGLDPQDIM